MFTSMFSANNNSNKDSSESSFPIHKLANEIVIKIIEKMDPEDRKQLALMDDRMCELEKIAGHRRFYCVEFAAGNDVCMSSQPTKDDFLISTPADENNMLFKNAKTEVFVIFGLLDTNAERVLHKATKTLEFNVLEIVVNNEVSYRQVLLCHFIQQRRCIEEIRIKWRINSAEESKKLLMNLPSMVKLSYISLCSEERFLDDELFLNLLHKSSGEIFFNCMQNSISTTGIAEAFQMVYGGKRKGKITCNPRAIEWANYCRHMLQYNDFKSTISEATLLQFKHNKSGATYTVDTKWWSRIEMAPAQSTL